MIYVLAVLPRDLAVMAILMYVSPLYCPPSFTNASFHSLSWCDTAASTIGRLYGRYTPPLPRRLLSLIPLAPRKSLAGTLAAFTTGTVTAMTMWGWAVPTWQGYGAAQAETWGEVSWKWEDAPGVGVMQGGWLSLVVVSLGTGIIAAVVEALGTSSHSIASQTGLLIVLT